MTKDRIRLSEWAVPAVLLAGLACLLVYTGWLWLWDLWIYDRQVKSWSRPPPDDIVIVAVNDESIRELGRWPWPRRIHAEIIRKITLADPTVLIVNVILAEPDPHDPEGDVLLAQAMQDSGRVVLPILNERVGPGGQLVEALPTSRLIGGAAALGHVDVELDGDGLARSVYLKGGIGAPYWSTLALAALESAGLSPPADLSTGDRFGDRGSSPFSWVRDDRVLIPFAGPPGHFNRVSYVDVLRGDFAEEVFRDKFVFLGVTAEGFAGSLPTPFSGLNQEMAGVEFNANVLDSLHRNLAIRPLSVPWSMVLTVNLVLFTALSFAFIRPGWIVAAVGLLMTLVLNTVLLRYDHLWFGPAPALLMLGLSYPVWIWRQRQLIGRALFAEREQAHITLRSIADGVITTNTEDLVEYMNPTAEILTGYGLREARGRPLRTIFRVLGEHPEESFKPSRKRDPDDEKEPVGPMADVVLRNADGQEYVVRVCSATIHDRNRKATGNVLTFSDMTDTQNMAQTIKHQATHDAVTGLPNRHLLNDRLSQAVARARRARGWFAAFFIDIDRFKAINDGLGHRAGDQLLEAVGDHLESHRRESDTVARIGGDEFVVVLENMVQEETVSVLAEKILKSLEEPFRVNGVEVFISVSIGVSLFPRDGGDVDELLNNADKAMYRAKELGGNNVQYYSKDLSVQGLDRLILEQHLRHALDRDEFEIHYQPQADLSSGRIIGVEALLRWRHPQGHSVSTADFIAVAEDTGLIIPIGQWVLQTACNQAKSWQDEGLPPLRTAVNLSPRQFMRQDLPDLVASLLKKTGLEARCLGLEITESTIIKDVEMAVTNMRSLNSMGVDIAIDDFGIGYSSLSYLKRFPINRLKIDKSFLQEVMMNRDDEAIASAIITMAHGMKLRVVAEGVETEAQVGFLRANSCDEIQGYLLSYPLPPNQLAALLRANNGQWVN